MNKATPINRHFLIKKRSLETFFKTLLTKQRSLMKPLPLIGVN